MFFGTKSVIIPWSSLLGLWLQKGQHLVLKFERRPFMLHGRKVFCVPGSKLAEAHPNGGSASATHLLAAPE